MFATSARRPTGVASAAVVVALLLTGCADDEPKEAPEAAPTPIGSLNTVAMQLPRIEFCGLVPSSAVADALGAKPDSDASYGNGDEVDLPVGGDVVHEIGCSWTVEGGSTARAWVFAPPITPEFARTVIASGKRTKGCRTVPGPAYGKPASTQLCRQPDGQQRVRHAGLFGQTWLTCELTATDGDPTGLRARTDSWCVAVANTLNTAR